MFRLHAGHKANGEGDTAMRIGGVFPVQHANMPCMQQSPSERDQRGRGRGRGARRPLQLRLLGSICLTGDTLHCTPTATDLRRAVHGAS